MVPGLGTRAVDRLGDDFPVLIAPGQPGLRVNVTPDEIMRYSPKRIDVINLEAGGFETIEAMRNPKIECIVAQHPWLENDCLYADIILPTNTTMEVEDIVTNIRQGVQFHSIAIQEQAVAPIGESKSDFEAVCEVAKKFGKIDWSQTKCMVQRSCHIYVNLKGREPQGCVEPGAEYEALLEALRIIAERTITTAVASTWGEPRTSPFVRTQPG